MISTAEFRNGEAIVLEGQLWVIVEFQHVKPGKGGAFVRTKLRRMRDGSVIERTFRAGEKFQDAYIEKRSLQYLYRVGETFHLMDTKSYEEVQVAVALIGQAAQHALSEPGTASCRWWDDFHQRIQDRINPSC